MKCLYPIADHPVHQFVMPVIRSNMYVLLDGNDALVIDPHISSEAEELLLGAGARECTVLLTHEHFDHISGVNRLRELFPCRVICTAECGVCLQNPKRSGAATFSALFLGHSEQEQQEIAPRIVPDYTCQADETYEGETNLEWHGISLVLKEVKGHSRGSQLIEAKGRYIFTGDNLVPGEKPVLRLPGSSRRIFEESVRPYLQGLPNHYIVYPGHGVVNCIAAEEMQYCLCE